MFKQLALLLPMFVCFFWSLIFFSQFPQKNKAQLLLGRFMFIAFLLFSSHALFFNKQIVLYFYSEGIFVFLMLLLAPLLYSYLRLFALPAKIQKKNYLPYIPAIVLSGIIFTTAFFIIEEERDYYLDNILVDRNPQSMGFSFISGLKSILYILVWLYFLFQVVFWGIKGTQLIKKSQRNRTHEYSNLKRAIMAWRRPIMIPILLLGIGSIFFSFIDRGYFLQNETLLMVPSLLFSGAFFTLGFIGNQQVQENWVSVEELEADNQDKKAENRAELKEQLLYVLEVQKIYKRMDLRLNSLADELKTNRTYISNIINGDFQMSFSDFINKYRVEEAKQLMRNGKQKSLTLEFIAEQSGFGSIHSFTRVFKSVEGIPPGKYRVNLKSSKT